MSTTMLNLRREGVGIELRRGPFDVSVDGKDAGVIDYGETAEIPLQAGHHTLRIRAGRYSSRDHAFEVVDGDVINFRCHGAMVWTRYLASFVKPDLAIALKSG